MLIRSCRLVSERGKGSTQSSRCNGLFTPPHLLCVRRVWGLEYRYVDAVLTYYWEANGGTRGTSTSCGRDFLPSRSGQRCFESTLSALVGALAPVRVLIFKTILNDHSSAYISSHRILLI